MAKKKERKKGVDADLDAFLNNDDALETSEENEPVASAKDEELQAFVEKPVSDKDKQREIEKQQKEAERVERKRLEDEQDAEAAAAQQQQDQQNAARGLASKVSQPILDKATQTVDNVSHASTAGGIGTLIVVLVVLLFVVVQVDQQGNTRFKMFWYMLNGRAKLDQRASLETPAGTTQTATQGSTASPKVTSPPPVLPLPIPGIGTVDIPLSYRSGSF